MAEGRLVQHHGEAIVLRTWPFHEADLLVSLFTREQGKVKGVARHAMRSRRRFGGALEPATHVRASYAERPRQDLARLDSFEIVWLPVTYFCLWMNRLMGWMPELGHCAVCGLDLRGGAVWWSAVGDGVTCFDDRRPGSQAVSAASVAESYAMFRTPLAALAESEWPAARAADLRGFAIGTLERHLEKRLMSARALGR